MSKLYIVTGACGHLGNTLVKDLLKKGENVRVLIFPSENTTPLKGLSVERVYGDVRNKKSLLPLFQNIDPEQTVVIHAAGIVSVASKYQQIVVDVNVEGTKNIVDLCIAHNVKRLVYVSSVHALPELPQGEIICERQEFSSEEVIGLYAKTKAKATAIVLDSVKKGLDAVVVHPSGIIGPNDFGHGHLTQMIVDYLNGGLTAGIKGGYDFVDVRDVSQGIIAASEKGKPQECYILSNRYYSVPELLNTIHEVSGKRKIKTILPNWFVKLTAPLAELYYKIMKKSPLFTSYTLYTLNSNANFSHEKAEKELGYQNRDFKQTIQDTIQFLKEQGRIKWKKLRRA